MTREQYLFRAACLRDVQRNMPSALSRLTLEPLTRALEEAALDLEQLETGEACSMKALADEFERPVMFMLQRYGHQAERIAVKWALALDAEGLMEPANHWRQVAGAIQAHSEPALGGETFARLAKIGNPRAA